MGAILRLLRALTKQVAVSLCVLGLLIPPVGIRAYQDVLSAPPPAPPRVVNVAERPAQVSGILPAKTPRAYAPAGKPGPLDAVSGKGSWFMIFSGDWTDPDADRAHALIDSAAGADLSHIYVRVADSRRHFYAGPALQDLLPIAHARGIRVIGWIEPELELPHSDAQDAIAAARYHRGAHRLDGLALTIEGVTHDPAVEQYLRAIRYGTVDDRGLGDSYLLIASTFPVPSQHRGYAYATLSRYCQVFAPMAYWRATGLRAFTGSEGVQAYLNRIFLEFQDPAVNPLHRPLTITAQAYDAAEEYGVAGSPPADEIVTSMELTRAYGGVSWSFYRLADASNGVTPDQSAAIAAYPFWQRATGPALGRNAVLSLPAQPVVY